MNAFCLLIFISLSCLPELARPSCTITDRSGKVHNLFPPKFRSCTSDPPSRMMLSVGFHACPLGNCGRSLSILVCWEFLSWMNFKEWFLQNYFAASVKMIVWFSPHSANAEITLIDFQILLKLAFLEEAPLVILCIEFNLLIFCWVS